MRIFTLLPCRSELEMFSGPSPPHPEVNKMIFRLFLSKQLTELTAMVCGVSVQRFVNKRRHKFST